MTRSVFIIFTGVEARLPFAKAGCPTESPVELLEKLWIPGPYSRTTELIFWLYKWGNWGAESLSNLIISKCCQHESSQYHNFNSKNVYFLKPHPWSISSKQLFSPLEPKNGTKHHHRFFLFLQKKIWKCIKSLCCYNKQTQKPEGSKNSFPPPPISLNCYFFLFPSFFPFLPPSLSLYSKSQIWINDGWKLVSFSNKAI